MLCAQLISELIKGFAESLRRPTRGEGWRPFPLGDRVLTQIRETSDLAFRAFGKSLSGIPEYF
jgi:hypothetical protein